MKLRWGKSIKFVFKNLNKPIHSIFHLLPSISVFISTLPPRLWFVAVPCAKKSEENFFDIHTKIQNSLRYEKFRGTPHSAFVALIFSNAEKQRKNVFNLTIKGWAYVQDLVWFVFTSRKFAIFNRMAICGFQINNIWRFISFQVPCYFLKSFNNFAGGEGIKRNGRELFCDGFLCLSSLNQHPVFSSASFSRCYRNVNLKGKYPFMKILSFLMRII